MDKRIEPAAFKKGELLFRKECTFVTGAGSSESIPPPTISEIAFAGRSNVGKSSLINAVVGRKGLARSSNTPGRTQQINFFNLGDALLIVDLPGYGYAKAPQKNVDVWNDMVRGYLRGRQTLKRVCLLVDSRHGLKASDQDAMEMLDASRVPYVIVLTKADKIKDAELTELVAQIEEELTSHPSAHPQACATSAGKKTGIAELRALLAAGMP